SDLAAVDVHGAGAADALAAGAAEGQRRIDLILDLDQRVQNHRAAGIEVDLIRIRPRILPVIGIPAVDAKCAHALRTGRRLEGLAMADAAVGGESESTHGVSTVLTGERGCCRHQVRYCPVSGVTLSKPASSAEIPRPRSSAS